MKLPTVWNARYGIPVHDPRLLHFNGKSKKIYMTKVLNTLTSHYIYHNDNASGECNASFRYNQWCLIAKHAIVKSIELFKFGINASRSIDVK